MAELATTSEEIGLLSSCDSGASTGSSESTQVKLLLDKLKSPDLLLGVGNAKHYVTLLLLERKDQQGLKVNMTRMFILPSELLNILVSP